MARRKAPETKENDEEPPVPIRPIAAIDEIEAELVEHSFNGIVIEQNGKVVLANTMACSILGAESCEELVGRDIDAFLPDTFWDSVKERLVKVHEGVPLVSPIETIIERLDGKSIDVEAVGVPIVFESGPGIEIVFRDITHRKETERTLKFTQYALDHASDATFWFRAHDGEIVYANDRAAWDFGYSTEELMTMTAFDIDPNISKDTWHDFIETVREKGYSRSTRLLKHHNGNMIAMDITRHFLDYEGRPFIIAFARKAPE